MRFWSYCLFEKQSKSSFKCSCGQFEENKYFLFNHENLLVLIMSLSVLDHLQSKSVSLRFEKASMNLPEVAVSLYFMLSKLGSSELCKYSISKLIQKCSNQTRNQNVTTVWVLMQITVIKKSSAPHPQLLFQIMTISPMIWGGVQQWFFTFAKLTAEPRQIVPTQHSYVVKAIYIHWNGRFKSAAHLTWLFLGFSDNRWQTISAESSEINGYTPGSCRRMETHTRATPSAL